MLTLDEATDVAATLLAKRNAEYERLDLIHDYLAGKSAPVYVPRDAREEYRWIAKQSRVNVLPLVVDTIAQNLYVDGYRSTESGVNAPQWGQWQANRMDARQTGVHRAALTYGVSYVQVLPGDMGPAWSPFSPRTMTAVYDDPINDEWPDYALTVTASIGGGVDVAVIGPECRYRFTAPNVNEDSRPEYVGQDVHGVPWCPVVRFVNTYDLDGQVRGEVAPLVPLQDQINLTTFNLLVAQVFGAFRQKWVTGMDVPKDDQGRPVEPFKAAVNRIFVGEGADTRFGDFNSTELRGYLDSRESTLRNLATIAQVPPNHLIGQMANMSAEALAAAEVQQTRKVAERKALFGESWEQVLGLSGQLTGAAVDPTAEVVWRDTEARSAAQIVDAAVKLRGIGFPIPYLAEMIGLTPQATETLLTHIEAEALAEASNQARAFGLTGMTDDADIA